MRNVLRMGLVFVLMLSMVLPTALAEGTTEGTTYTDDPAIDVTLEGSLNDLGKVDLTWTEYTEGDLKWYKIVHSVVNDAPKYPEDSYVDYYSDSILTTYTHTSPQAGTNYYAVCVITDTNMRGCSNTVTIEKDGTTTDTTDKTTDSTYTDDPAITFNLVATLNDLGKVDMTWDMYEGGDLKWYKVVRSSDNPEPVYPDDSYIGVYTDAAETTHADTDVPAGLSYYRVCVVTTENMRGCSNVVEVTKEGVEKPTDSFADIEGHWAKTYIDNLYVKEVVEGRDGNFEPNGEIFRSEAVKMIIVAFNKDSGNCDATLFPDVNSDHWFCGYITKAFVSGYVQGDQGYFYPGRTLNRAEAVILILKIKGITPPDIEVDPFPDVPHDSWYGSYAYKAKKLGLVEGIEGEFKPFQEITRAEFAKLVSIAIN